MTVPSSGVISMTDVQNTFGGPTPIALGNYYAGGGIIPNPPPSSPFQIGGPIPTSGVISLFMFIGTESEFVFNDVIASNRTGGYNLYNAAVAAGWNQSSKLTATVTINGGVFLTGGFYTGSGFPSGSSLTLNNYGVIVGQGGEGGIGAGFAGGNGGTALTASHPIYVRNNGWICGGGGGGGGGVPADGWKDSQPNNSYGGGGGGGGGAGFGSGGRGGDGTIDSLFSYANGYTMGSPGGSGSEQYGGAGGAGNYGGLGQGGYGGRGGNLAGFGWSGGLPSANGWVSPGVGGSPGAAIVGGANITWRYHTGVIGGSVDDFGNADLGSFQGGNPPGMANGYKNVIFSYPRNNPMGDTAWWPTTSDGQGYVTYPFATLVTNPLSLPMAVRFRGSIDDAITSIWVNGVQVYNGGTLNWDAVYYSPTFNLQPGINLVEMYCSNTVNNSPAWMCIELQRVSNGEVLVPTWAWRQP